eukprot:TRINITY_DN17103_c0_g3_i1.p1 TRINITY_DN17103_c0_g3~~TRINITY_DN17103_c0_g3_i1.p1  ORF type:complete len:335 (-),score=44.09 TRINITY_DN17103_c0_g3_i1:276-1280(-)
MAEELKSSFVPITLQDIIKFLFPSNIQHPNSSSRLFILAENGPLYAEHSYYACLCGKCKNECRDRRNQSPLCRQIYGGHHITPDMLAELTWICDVCAEHITSIVHLKGGPGGRHIVSDQELAQMEIFLRRNDVLALYLPKDRCLSVREQQELLDELPANHRKPHNYTVEEIVSMFEGCTVDGNGAMEFHEVSRVIQQAHQHFLKQAKKMFPDLVKKSSKPSSATKQTISLLATSGQFNSSSLSSTLAQSTTRTVVAFSRSHTQSKLVRPDFLLHRNTHKLAMLNDKDNPELTNNVRILRNLESDTSSAWNNTCCLTQTNRPSYVKPAHKISHDP